MWVAALIAAAYTVYAMNPMSASHYRDRYATSRAENDPGDAHVLADPGRTDRHQRRAVAGDSELAESVKVLARARQNLIWSRQRQVNALRSAPRGFYPAALEVLPELAHRDALAVLAVAPTPAGGPGTAGGRAPRGGSAPSRPKPSRSSPVCDGRQRHRPRRDHHHDARPDPGPQGTSWGRLLSSTRTQGSCVVCPDMEWSPAPGCSRTTAPPQSATTRREQEVLANNDNSVTFYSQPGPGELLDESPGE